VLLVPLVLAELGRDYLVPRNFAPAWIPLAVVLGAACTVPRARSVGAALAVVLLVAFVYAGVRIGNSPQYQRPDWRDVASALGPASGSRAILAYDAGFAAQPLAIYLHGVAWSQPPPTPVTVGEVDVVGSVYQQPPQNLPAGARLLSSKVVKGGFLVDRFSVPGWRLTPAQLAARAPTLLGPAGAAPGVLFQTA
jgi:hypothetical protein